MAAIIIAAIAVISNGDDNPADGRDGIASLTGGFVDGVLTIEPDNENGFTITVDDGHDYSRYVVIRLRVPYGENEEFRVITDYADSLVVKDSDYTSTEPNKIIWVSRSVNRCAVSVKCINESGYET